MTDVSRFLRDVSSVLENHQACPWFEPRYGLCDNVTRWAEYYHFDTRDLTNNLIDLFRRDGLNTCFPFNQDLDDYRLESQSGMLYDNPKRLAFIRRYAR